MPTTKQPMITYGRIFFRYLTSTTPIHTSSTTATAALTGAVTREIGTYHGVVLLYAGLTPLNELIPDWQAKGAPLTVPVSENHHWILTKSGKFGMPHLLMPPFMKNKA